MNCTSPTMMIGLLAAIIATGCATTERNRSAAHKQNTTAEERTRLDTLHFQEAQKENTIQAYEKYLSSSGVGHVAEARSALELLYFQEVNQKGTPAAYRRFLTRFPSSARAAELRRQLMSGFYSSDATLAQQRKSGIKLTAAFPAAQVKVITQVPPRMHSEEARGWFAKCMTTGIRVDGQEVTVVEPGVYGAVIALPVKRTSAVGQQVSTFGYNREWIVGGHYKTGQYQVVVMGPVREGTIIMPARVNEQWSADGVEAVIVSVEKDNPDDLELCLLLTIELKEGQKYVREGFQILAPIDVEFDRR